MAGPETLKRVVLVVAVLSALAAANTADAQQRKRMPVRIGEIPDTESGRPAASAERPTFKGRLIIYGPQEPLPVTPPPEHIAKPPAQAAPVAAPEPAKPAAPAPVAAPAPAPTPPAPVVVVPAPAPPPPAPVAVPIPATPAPVAAPKPEPKPAPLATPAPAPKPAPVIAAPAPEPKPAPAVAASAPREPIVREPIVREPIVRQPIVREPVVRSEPARPASAVKPSPVALAAPSAAAVSAAAAPVAIETKLIESIFHCLSPGLPPDWKRAWVEVTDEGAGKEKVSRFRVSTIRGTEDEAEPLVPCNAQALTRSIVGLNEKLPPDRRTWSRALLVIDSDGDYELTYDYPK